MTISPASTIGPTRATWDEPCCTGGSRKASSWSLSSMALKPPGMAKKPEW